MTPLKSLPTLRRPRERLQESGVQLSVEDLVAAVIGSGYKGSDVLEVSRRVCDRLLIGQSSAQELSRVPGVGAAKAAAICAALQLSSALVQRQNGMILADPEAIYRACQDIVDEPQEHLVVFYLTSRNLQIARDTVSIGTATASLIHSREVFRPAILHNASHVILAHNHPSGDPSPSQADYESTLRMAQAGRNLGIEVLDHVICGSSWISLKATRPELFF